MKWQLIFIALLIPICVDAALNCTILNETCNATDVFHMSNVTNAHAEQNNESNYEFIVCCNETQGYTLNISHGTELLTLSSSTNAHAEQNNESSYDYPIYMNVSNGSISCHYNTSACAEACLGTISSHTNAHTADCSTDPYSYNICCQWANETTPTTTNETEETALPRGGVPTTPPAIPEEQVTNATIGTPTSSSILGYGYMGAIMAGVFIFFIFVDKSMQKKEYGKKPNRYDKLFKLVRKNIIWLLIMFVLSYQLLKPENIIGYIVMIAISMIFFTAIIFIKAKNKKKMRKNEP